jgi:PAS domain S-box-containing protein
MLCTRELAGTTTDMKKQIPIAVYASEDSLSQRLRTNLAGDGSERVIHYAPDESSLKRTLTQHACEALVLLESHDVRGALQLVRSVRRSQPGIVIVGLLASSNPEAMVRWFRAGVTECLTPKEWAKLKDTISRLTRDDRSQTRLRGYRFRVEGTSTSVSAAGAEPRVAGSPDGLRGWDTLFFREAPVGMLVEDCDARIVDANTAFCTALGYDREDLVGKSVRVIVPTHLWDSVDRHLADILAGGSMEHEVVNLHKNGSIRHFHLHERRVTLAPGEDGILVISHDITGQRESKELLRDSESRLRSMLQAIPDLMFINDASGTFLDYHSPENSPLYRQPPAFLGKRVGEVFDRGHAETFSAVVRKAIETGELQIYEYSLPIGDKLHHYDARSAKIDGDRVLTIVRDVTTRKQAETALEESEGRFRHIVEGTNAVIITGDLRGIITHANEAACAGLGLQFGELVGRQFTDFIVPEDREHTIRTFYRQLRNHGSGSQLDFRFMKPTGVTGWYSCFIAPEVRNGRIVGMTSIGVDVTDLKRAEEAAREGEAKLHAVFENLPFAFWVADRTGTITMQNTVSTTLFGDQIGRPVTGIGKSLGLDGRWNEVVNRAMKGELLRHEQKVARGSETRWYQGILAPIREGEAVIGVLGTAIDITDRKRAEGELTRTYQQLSTLVNSAPLPIVATDAGTNITIWNPAAERLFGWSAEEVIGKPNPIIPREKRDEFARMHEQVKVHGRYQDVEVQRMKKDGTMVDVSISTAQLLTPQGDIDGYIAMLLDVSKRKRDEDQIRHSMSLLRATLESTADGILVVSNAGNIEGYNKRFQSMWKLPQATLDTKDDSLALAFVLDQLKDPEQFLMKVRELYGQPLAESFDVLELRDGRMFERVSIPQRLGTDPAGRVWSFRDVTDRKQAEERLRLSLQEKEILLKEIHHRVKNNLQIVSSLLNLQSKHATTDAVRDLFRESQIRVRSMALIHEKLYKSKDLAHIDFGQYIRSLSDYLYRSYVVNADLIKLSIDIQDVQLGLDAAIPCGLIISELVSNSVKYAFPGGRGGEIRIQLHTTTEGDRELIVADNGVGLPSNLDIHHSSTLGLQLVNSLVNQLRAAMDVTSKGGTEFHIRFHESGNHSPM